MWTDVTNVVAGHTCSGSWMRSCSLLRCSDTGLEDQNIRGTGAPHQRVCLVMDGDEDEFLLDRQTLQNISIDIDRMFEQLANDGHVSDDADDDDVTNDSPWLAFGVDMDKIHACVDKMLLRFGYDDIWHVNIAEYPPANVELWKMWPRKGTEPYRSGTRKHPLQQRAFVREFVQVLERHGLSDMD
ncbi:hypothetical protein PHMEG_00035124 [Phytophthora megakarya]|uniref:Uncharacterized protein n=1 Tax=Phytophthora megakarya TaxID=4795 RepID=A0A225UPG3_9STRA|nr:hypothetical protein PHMEG_00035124 [Phytophthora megakarya]